MLPVGGIEEKLLAAHRCGAGRRSCRGGTEREVDEDLGEELRRAVEVHYVTRVDELLEPATSSAAPAGCPESR